MLEKEGKSFEELEHQDPGVTFIPPSAGNSWERVTTDSDTRYYLSAVPLSPDSNFTSMNRERVDTGTYSRVKGYKYAYMISFRNNGGKRVEFGSAVVLDSTKTRSYIFYKSTNELLG